jgi:hypothetical protein
LYYLYLCFCFIFKWPSFASCNNTLRIIVIISTGLFQPFLAGVTTYGERDGEAAGIDFCFLFGSAEAEATDDVGLLALILLNESFLLNALMACY